MGLVCENKNFFLFYENLFFYLGKKKKREFCYLIVDIGSGDCKVFKVLDSCG